MMEKDNEEIGKTTSVPQRLQETYLKMFYYLKRIKRRLNCWTEGRVFMHHVMTVMLAYVAMCE